MSTTEGKLEKLFGSKSRVTILKFFTNNQEEQFRVNEIIRKTFVNSHLASTELKKLAEIGILTQKISGNAVMYQADKNSPLLKPLQEILKDHDWFEWERPSRIHHLVLTLEASLKPMKEYYGHNLPEAHLIFRYDNVTWFFKIKDWQKLGQKLLPIYQKRKKKIWNDFEKYASTLWNHQNYSSFYKNYINFWKVAWITEPLSMYIDSLLQPGEQIAINNKSFTDDYENQLWKLAKKAEKIGLEKIDVNPLIGKYFWIRNSYYGIHRLTKEEVRTEVGKKIGKKKIIPKTPKDPSSLPKELIVVGKEMVLLQDIRKKYMMKAAYYLHEFLKNIGKKHNIPPIEMMQTIPLEVLNFDKKISDISEELKLRLKSCTITDTLTDGMKVYSGQIIFPSGIQRQSKLDLRGMVACGGKAIGRAKIVKNVNDVSKVNHGDIIVSPMTSPELMPAIRRCVAIVTNFGGITCHAAIISREFNVPCIVGTNDATELIKDEDLVEVDANEGVVRVLQTGI
jgi:phosphoenolpyruvate synthase/pyruvate phosphate dikinase